MRAGNVGMPLEWWGIRASVIHFLGEGARSSVRHWLLSASDRFHRELVARWRELDCKLSAFAVVNANKLKWPQSAKTSHGRREGVQGWKEVDMRPC